MTWNPGRSAFSLMGGLLESELSMAKKAACLSICDCTKDRAAMIFLPNAAWVSFPLSTLTENATTHFLCVIFGADFLGGSALTASAKVAVFLSFFEDPEGGVLCPFLRSSPFIASKFAGFSGTDASSSDRVFLLRLDRSSSEPLGEDFLDSAVRSALPSP